MLHIRKPWQVLNEAAVARLPGQLGVYELAGSNGRVFFLGYAGGRSRFGLRGELERHFMDRQGQTTRFRYEVNMQYLSRYEELLMMHQREHGGPPEETTDLPRRIGGSRAACHGRDDDGQDESS